jgi:hypothetical protein
MDNNTAERSERGPVVGRKNSTGSSPNRVGGKSPVRASKPLDF